jgi:flagellar motor switch protein FliM
LYTFQIKNTDIKGILELNSDLALTLVDRLLGGNGSSAKQTKIITLIEQKVLNVVVEKIMLDLRKTWHVIDNYEFIPDRFEPDIDFVQLTSPNESVLLISFELSFGEITYLMNLCFATFAFDSILTKMSTQMHASIRPKSREGLSAREIITQHLSETLLPVSVELGKTTISLSELASLKVGDVLVLENRVQDEHLIRVNDKVAFWGHPGTSNNHKAIKITKSLLRNNSI